MRQARAAAFAVALSACLSRVDTQSAVSHAGTDGGAVLPISGEEQDSGAALRVTITASAKTLCPGQCVDLTAVASGGAAPYSYGWTGGPAAVGAQERDCPSQSTTYTVVATDSSGSSGEFSSPPARASASVSIGVASSCSDDGGPAEPLDGLAPDTAPPLPSTGPSFLCSASWPAGDPLTNYPTIRGANTAVAVDSAGNIVFAGFFTHSITIGGHAIAAAGSIDLVLVKLDSQCRILWTKQIGAYEASVYPMAVAFDASGDIALGGYFETSSNIPGIGDVDFGTGAHSAAHTAAFVVKLDPAGNTSWANVYSGNGSGFDYVAVEDLATRAGGVVVVMRSDTPIDFGSGVITTDAGTTERYLIELGPSGSLTFAKPSESFEPSPWLLQSVDTAPDGSIWIGGTGQPDSFANGLPGSSTLYAVHLDANATVLASQTWMPPTSVPWNGAAVRVGPSGDAVVSAAWAADNTGVSWTRWLAGLSSHGTVSWTYPSLSSGGSSSDPAEVVRVDAYGRTWLAGEFMGDLALGAPVGTFSGATNMPSGDVVVLGTNGRAVSGSAPSQLANSIIADMALAPGNGIVVAGWSGAEPNASLFVSKFGF